ncbi:MAG: hypothetical protein EOP84_12095 [Verrucomicrobiaceae bacterium]|nr:MAG: hypothetical protein EOP84_12095 [Verrucomicrobiaceae bacterium]
MKSVFLALLLTVGTVIAETPSLSPLLEFRTGRTRIVIPQRDPQGPHDWYEASCRGGIEKSVLHAFVRREDTLYILFHCEGWSRGSAQPKGRCGGGYERQINWMAIRNGRVIEHQQRDIVSCWRDAEGTIEGWRGDLFFWSADTPEEFYTAFFDRKAPEKGMQIKEIQKHGSQ